MDNASHLKVASMRRQEVLTNPYGKALCRMLQRSVRLLLSSVTERTLLLPYIYIYIEKEDCRSLTSS